MEADNAPAPSRTLGRQPGTATGPACQTCRYRKSRCDRRRPQCSICRRLDTACEYRELPSAKYKLLNLSSCHLCVIKADVSMFDFFESLQRVEQKLDSLALNSSSTADTNLLDSVLEGQRPSLGSADRSQLMLSVHDRQSSLRTYDHLLSQLQKSSAHLAVPHKVLLWPRIYSDLASLHASVALDLQSIVREGTSWFARKEAAKYPPALPADIGLPCFAVNVNDRATGRAPNISFPTLSPDQVRKTSAAYFETFNLLYPILAQEHFLSEIQEKILREGYRDGDTASVILLLVIALGQVSIDGVMGPPISTIDGRASGFRGGSIESPPGLAAFNEARRRSGFVATECTLEVVQILLLQMLYFESHGRHIEYWQAVTAASLAFQGLLKVRSTDWKSPRGDQMKCVFWTCVMNETFYHIDLDLPRTNIHELEDAVPLPDFQNSPGNSTEIAPTVHWIFHAQFLALIALRSIIGRIHEIMQTAEVTVARAGSADQPTIPPIFVVHELTRQLDNWQRSLPRMLHWSTWDSSGSDDNHLQLSQPAEPSNSTITSSMKAGQQQAYKIATEQLRTRFYYARFMLHRSFVYKALHIPERMTAVDANYCAVAIRSACQLPYAINSTKDRKRLFPHMFAWTQTCIGTFLVLRMALKDDCLRSICEDQVEHHEITDAMMTVSDWLRDTKQLDGIADWFWTIMNNFSFDVEN